VLDHVIEPPRFPKLQQDITTEVAVIGAGISGLTTAYLLAKEGKKVVVIEDGEIASGETSRSTAHISNAFDDHYFEVAKLHGKDAAAIVAESHTAAIDQIDAIVTKEGIDCEFERVDGFLFPASHNSSDIGDVNKEYFAAKEAGLQDVELLQELPIPSIKASPVLRFPRQGQFNPVKYLFGLANVLKNLGVQIFTNTHAAHFTSGHPQVVLTSDNVSVTAEFLVVATNVPVNDRIEMYTKLDPERTVVLVAKIPKGSVKKALYWDTLENYHYIRTAPLNDVSDYLLVGGEDYRVGENSQTNERIEALKSWTKAFFPMIEQVIGIYTGQIIEPVDTIAYIGRNPLDSDNVFIITGDSGNGITHGTIGGILIRDLILGRPNRWEKLYSPSRKPTSNIGDFIKHNAKTGLHYASWLTPGEKSDIEDIIPGTGAVFRCGLSKVAVYKDEHGKVFECSAVCPHLGGIVTWNNLEKSWDCPVHGSRFDRFGNVVNGPANKGLAPRHGSKGEK